jgi:hypothetical protein
VTAEQTLDSLKKVMEKRKAYVRYKYSTIEQKGREVQPQLEQMLRGGMLSELSTINGILQMLESGDNRVLDWWKEDEYETV